jgi:hypothetical protein
MIFPVLAEAQDIEFVRPADFRYYVVVNGDSLANRAADYKAYQDGVMYRCMYPDADIIIQPIGLEIRGSCPYSKNVVSEIITDTVWKEAPLPDYAIIQDLDFTYEGHSNKIEFKIEMLAARYNFRLFCGEQTLMDITRNSIESINQYIVKKNIACDEDIAYYIHAFNNQHGMSQEGLIPNWVFNE